MHRFAGRPASFAVHLERVAKWLASQPNFGVLYVSYNWLVSDRASETAKVCEFLAGRCNVERMLVAIDPSLYRNRKELVGPA